MPYFLRFESAPESYGEWRKHRRWRRRKSRTSTTVNGGQGQTPFLPSLNGACLSLPGPQHIIFMQTKSAPNPLSIDLDLNRTSPPVQDSTISSTAPSNTYTSSLYCSPPTQPPILLSIFPFKVRPSPTHPPAYQRQRQRQYPDQPLKSSMIPTISISISISIHIPKPLPVPIPLLPVLPGLLLPRLQFLVVDAPARRGRHAVAAVCICIGVCVGWMHGFVG